jgi:hypothetical protein
MGLREIAEQDLGTILEDGVTGFGWPITLTAPDGTVGALTGFSDDIAQVIDPDTGQAISGRLASAALRIARIEAALPGKGLPVGIADAASKPWLVAFEDINGTPYTFRVAQSNPDRAIGLVTLLLEVYTP